MSVVAALVTDEVIHIAADSALLKGEQKRTDNFSKLIRHESIIVGGSGEAEELSLFQRFVEDKKPTSNTIRGIQDYMVDFLSFKNELIPDSQINNCYLIVYEGHLFEVEGLFVQEIKDYAAVGSGDSYALATLYLGHNAKQAVEVACHLCCSVSEPIVEFVCEKAR